MINVYAYCSIIDMLILLMSNFTSNLAAGFLFLTVSVTFASQMDIPTEPLTGLITISVVTSLTPGASPMAVMMLVNTKWVGSAGTYKVIISTLFMCAVVLAAVDTLLTNLLLA